MTTMAGPIKFPIRRDASPSIESGGGGEQGGVVNRTADADLAVGDRSRGWWQVDAGEHFAGLDAGTVARLKPRLDAQRNRRTRTEQPVTFADWANDEMGNFIANMNVRNDKKSGE